MLLGDPRKAIRTMTVPLLIALLVIQVNALADRAGLLCLPPLRLRGKGRVVLHWLQPACDLCRPMPLDVFPAGWAQAC